MTAENEPTLTVFHDEVPIITSYGKWLHPLFELADFLADHSMQSENLTLQDKIIGKAAALLIHRLGFRTVQAGILSRLGEDVLQRHDSVYTYGQLVDRIHCQTEELLAEVEDPEKTYCLLKVRAGRYRLSSLLRVCGDVSAHSKIIFLPQRGVSVFVLGGHETGFKSVQAQLSQSVTCPLPLRIKLS